MYMRDTKVEGTVDTKNKELTPLSSHQDGYQDYNENTKQILLCLLTKIKNCDPLVTLFLFVSLQPKISNTPFDQNSPGHREVGVLNCHTQTDKRTS